MSDSNKTQVKFKQTPEKTQSQERQPCLTIIDGNNIGEVYPIANSMTVIGRADDADIILVDTGISRRHATIELSEGSYIVNDLQSTNGTIVNGRTVSSHNLEDGDRLQLGDLVLRFSFLDALDSDYQKQLRDMAVRDGLTGIYNKRYLITAMENEFNYSSRHRTPLSVIMFDVDHFKKFNDTYGHAAGDYVLQNIASHIEKGVRGYDVFARYGGEEFTFLMRNAGQQPAKVCAERVRKLIEDFDFQYDGITFNVTISVGVATFEGDIDSQNAPQTAGELIEKADQQLYKAKAAGRNRVCCTTD